MSEDLPGSAADEAAKEKKAPAWLPSGACRRRRLGPGRDPRARGGDRARRPPLAGARPGAEPQLRAAAQSTSWSPPASLFHVDSPRPLLGAAAGALPQAGGGRAAGQARGPRQGAGPGAAQARGDPGGADPQDPRAGGRARSSSPRRSAPRRSSCSGTRSSSTGSPTTWPPAAWSASTPTSSRPTWPRCRASSPSRWR